MSGAGAHAGADDLAELRVAVVHRRDRTGETIVRHLQRLGCRVQQFWPAPAELPRPLDAVFFEFSGETGALPWVAGDAPAPIVAVTEGEGAGLRGLSSCGAHAVLVGPAEATAVLTNLMLARNNFRYEKRLLAKIAKLEDTLRSLRKVEQAKAILMKEKNIEEGEAYRYLREQAMNRRVSIVTVASAIVGAKEYLA